MRKQLCCIAFLSISIGANAEKMDTHIYGQWKITGVADAQETTSLSSDQADLLKGLNLVIAPKTVQFNGDVCTHPVFTVSRQNTMTFFLKAYKFDPKNLLLPDQVSEIQINCKNFSEINFLYIQNRRKIIFYWKGFFLRAVK